MDAIRIVLSDSRRTEAKEIELLCLILQYSSIATPESMALSEKKLIDYLEKLGVTYYVSMAGKVDAGEKIAAKNKYKVVLNRQTYPLFQEYLNENTDILAAPQSALFFEKDRERILQDLGLRAGVQAAKIAADEGRLLKAEYDVRELEPERKTWVIYPPTSYHMNYMMMPMEVKFEFTFWLE